MGPRLLIFLLGLGCLLPQPVPGQVVIGAAGEGRPRVRLTGIHADLGVVNPQDAKTGFVFGGGLDLGTALATWLHLGAGVSYWSNEYDRDAEVQGELRDFRVHVDLRLDLLPARDIEPYVLAGVATHVVRADLPGNPILQDALEGYNPGAELGFGVAKKTGHLRLSTEFRRQFVEDVGNWTITAGIGWLRDAYRSSRSQTTRASSGEFWDIHTADSPRPSAPTETRVARTDESSVPLRREMPSATRLEELDGLVQQLVDENLLIRAELESLRARVHAPATPMKPTDAVVASDVVPSRRQEIQDALVRLAGIQGQTDSVHDRGDGLVLSLQGSVLFGFGSSDLRVEAQEELRRVAAVLLRFPETQVIVEGHSDTVGHPEANRMLSRRRAVAVMEELVRIGVDASRVRAVGFGSKRPVADNDTLAGRASNRRVELRIVETSVADR